MAGITKIREGNDDIYEAVVAVEGGQVVVPDTGATNPGVQGIQPAGADAHNVLGVAGRRAEPVASQNLTGTDGDGYPFVDVNPVNELTVVYRGCVVPVNYAPGTAVAFGDKIKSAASGEVTLWVSGTDASDLCIGECRVIGGVGAAGATLAPALIY